MSFLRVIAGELKGKNIPFTVNKFNNADITPQKVKGAIFSKIGEYLHGKSFLDLYAGSGQIAVEALSRGAGPVVINEADKKRFVFIKQFISDLERNGDVVLLNFFANRTLAYLHKKDLSFDYIFIDPPYEKHDHSPQLYKEILLNIEKNKSVKDDGIVIIQHFSKNKMEERVGHFVLIDVKAYGTSSLSFYQA